MTEPAFNWKHPAGRALELALNRALALDPDTRAGLRALDGQRIALILASPPLGHSPAYLSRESSFMNSVLIVIVSILSSF